VTTPVRRVLVDAAIVKPNLGGLRTYIRSLVGALDDRGDVGLVVATSRPEEFAHAATAEIVAVPKATQNFTTRAAWREANLARLVQRTGADAVLVPYPEMSARRQRVPSVMVVHDVRAVVAPRYDSPGRRLRFVTALGPACRAASHVVCVSEFTRLSLDACVRLDPSHVSVIGEAASAQVIVPDDLAAPARPFVLHVGSLMPHKNVDTLVRAFALDGVEHDLVLVGPATPGEARHLSGLIEDLGCGRRVHPLGWVDDAELGRLYGTARAVVIPSIHEGFGLPVLEAMQHGVPVVASDIAAFREVGGGHLTLVDRPLDPVAWRDALARLETDPPDLTAATEWAARWTWDDVAGQFVKLFDDLAERTR
jgi:glycosyltransferase involved in cell wall biosynthesis